MIDKVNYEQVYHNQVDTVNKTIREWGMKVVSTYDTETDKVIIKFTYPLEFTALCSLALSIYAVPKGTNSIVYEHRKFRLTVIE